jgi:hypothetical protein
MPEHSSFVVHLAVGMLSTEFYVPGAKNFDLVEVVGKLIRADLRPVWGLNKAFVIVLEDLKETESKRSEVRLCSKIGRSDRST